MRKKTKEREIFEEHLLRSKGSKQLLGDVGSGEFRSDVLQRVLLDFFNSKLFEPVRTRNEKFVENTYCGRQRIHRTRRTPLLPLDLSIRGWINVISGSQEGRKVHLVCVDVGKERHPPTTHVNHFVTEEVENNLRFPCP
jgi:hypothetical protein